MATNEQSITASIPSVPLSGDVVGGGVLALAGLVHLFGLQLGGTGGTFVLLVVWPVLAGAIGAVVEQRSRPGSAKDLPLIGAVTGVFGAVITALMIFLTGLAGVWSSFVFETFGVELVPVTLGAAILFLITWTVSGYAGGYAVGRALE